MGDNGISCVVLHLGHYLYTEDLVKLNSCRPHAGKLSVEERLSGVFTLPEWESMLEHHSDRVYADFILNGIKDGFGWATIAPVRVNLLCPRQEKT